VDEKIKSIIEKKINETIENLDEVSKLSDSVENLSQSKRDFCYGVIIGRLYNSFYYQTRRILERSPTDTEFLEFIKIIQNHENDFERLNF